MIQDLLNPSKPKPNHHDQGENWPKTFHTKPRSLVPHDPCVLRQIEVEKRNRHLSASLCQIEKMGKEYSGDPKRDLSYSSHFGPHPNHVSNQKNQSKVLKENHSIVGSENVRMNRPSDFLYSNNSSSGDMFFAKESSQSHKEQKSDRPKCNALSFANILGGPGRPGLSSGTSGKNGDSKDLDLSPEKEFDKDESPEQSSFFSTGDAYEDRSLLDDSINLLIEDTKVDAAPQRPSNVVFDFVEMTEGQFKCVHVGGRTRKLFKEQWEIRNGTRTWCVVQEIHTKSSTKNSKRKNCSELPSPKKLAVPKERKETTVPGSEQNHEPSKHTKAIDDATSSFMSSKKDKRPIYSGKRTARVVTPLSAMCSDIIKKNILNKRNVRFARHVPFKYVRPFLEMCSASRLRHVEELNTHLSRYTGYIWENIYKKEFRDQPLIAGKQFKDMYWTARMKRDQKLKSLTASISKGRAKAQTERHAKLVSVPDPDSNPEVRSKKRAEEPPKIVLNGRVSGSSSNTKPGASPKTILNGKPGSSYTKSDCPDSSPRMPIESKNFASNRKSSGSESSCSPVLVQKPIKVSKPPKKTVAPLMSKTKKMMNIVSRRR